MRKLIEVKTLNLERGTMKAVALARPPRKHFFLLFLGIFSAFSLASTAWSYSVLQSQSCFSNCDMRTVSFTPADRSSGSEPMDLSSASDVRATTQDPALSHTEQGSSTAQANKNPATEAASTPAPSFFLLLGFGLIGIRLVISYRSKKLKNLATETH